MKNFTEEDYREIELSLNKEIAFLKSHGWQHDLKTRQFFDPVTQKPYAFLKAVDTLQYRIVKEQNWKSVCIAVHHDKLPRCREQGVFESPCSGKIYTWPEVVKLVFGNEKETSIKSSKFSLDISEQIPRPVDSNYSYHFKFTRDSSEQDNLRYVYIGKTFDHYRPLRIEAAAKEENDE